MTQEVPLYQFRYRDRLQLAWSLAWPCAMVDLIYRLIYERTKDHPGLPEHALVVIDLVVRLLLFFSFSTLGGSQDRASELSEVSSGRDSGQLPEADTRDEVP
jgi:hypothetical protein